jgi:hypothetical protein
LNRFLLLAHSDLKKFLFSYWFAFPALSFDGEGTPPFQNEKTVSIYEFLSSKQVELLQTSVQQLKQTQTQTQSFFTVKKEEKDSDSIKVGSLSDWNEFYPSGGREEEGGEKEVTVGFIDSCHLKQHPGWPLRNFLVLLARKFHVRIANVIAYRESKGSISPSIVIRARLPKVNGNSIPFLSNSSLIHSLIHQFFLFVLVLVLALVLVLVFSLFVREHEGESGWMGEGWFWKDSTKNGELGVDNGSSEIGFECSGFEPSVDEMETFAFSQLGKNSCH